MASDVLLETSAIVALILAEPEADALAANLAEASSVSVTPLATFEAALVIATRKAIPVPQAMDLVERLLLLAGALRIAVTPDMAAIAAESAERFGKGRGHPARLNLCDCLAYAAAKATGTDLLYVGDDFARTDLRSPSRRG